jgi:hypothetical protein
MATPWQCNENADGFISMAVSQLAEMTHPNRLFISAFEGPQFGADFDGSHIRD